MKWKPTVPAAVSAIRATRTILSGRNFCTAAPARLDSRAFQVAKKKTTADARGLTRIKSMAAGILALLGISNSSALHSAVAASITKVNGHADDQPYNKTNPCGQG